MLFFVYSTSIFDEFIIGMELPYNLPAQLLIKKSGQDF